MITEKCDSSRARVAVFDIDGTLAATNEVDDACFTRAVAHGLGVDESSIDWTDAPHMTDSGLLEWLADRHGLIPVHADGVRDHFVALLSDAARAEPQRFSAVPGAVTAVAAARDAGWTIAIATGCWERSARMKLDLIGLDHRAIPVATSDDARARADIMRIALERTGLNAANCERVVYVGDGSWDVRAAAALGWPLVGIGTGERAERLRRHGASTVLDNFLDVGAFLRALDTAGVPIFRA
jgi:phosphoglycolate phosphatase-like HAD superfamily hydrolase